MSELIERQKLWYKINQPLGEELGYPECCIKEFCDQPPEHLEVSEPTPDDVLRFEAGCIENVFTGFVPCKFHAQQILSGEIKLDELIKNRNKLLPEFPNA